MVGYIEYLQKAIDYIESVCGQDKDRYWLEEVIEKDGILYMDIYLPIS